MSEDKEVIRIDVIASILGGKKSHSWFYILRPSWVVVKAEKGNEE